MAFKINIDRFGFAEKPNPEKVSRDYAAEMVRDEIKARQEADTQLENLIEAETGARIAADNLLQSNIEENNKNIENLESKLSNEVIERQTKDSTLESAIGANTENISSLRADLTSETGARSYQDGVLQTNINSEAQARADEDESLKTLITFEQSERRKAVSELQIDLNNEKINRSFADGELEGKITAEAEARIAADENLQSQINNKADIANPSLGFQAGFGATSGAGGSAGLNAKSTTGFSGGQGTESTTGAAVGSGTVAGKGFSGGEGAKAYKNLLGDKTVIDTIQLGKGTNYNQKTLQVYDHTVMNADGSLPYVHTAVPYNYTTLSDTLELNSIYDLGEQTSIDLTLPTAQTGNFIQVDFISGDTPTTFTISTSAAVVSDYDFVPESNRVYSLFFDYGRLTADIYGWRFSYAEYTYTEV